jgi:hypothetical protein
MPPNQNPIYTVETKDFIPSGPIDWFKTLPFLPLMLLRKEIWPTFPPPLKLIFPLKMASSKKSPLELLALLKKSPHIKPSSRNIGIFFPGHTWKCPGLDPSIFEHHIDIWPDIIPVRKK